MFCASPRLTAQNNDFYPIAALLQGPVLLPVTSVEIVCVIALCLIGNLNRRRIRCPRIRVTCSDRYLFRCNYFHGTIEMILILSQLPQEFPSPPPPPLRPQIR
jgi:hypothetical protein